MSHITNKTAPINLPIRNADGTLNLAYYKDRAQSQRANTIRHFGKLVQALIGFQR